ncbi:MAG TPA: polysaccharide deacetylase family protein [Candidatus Pullilachnospira intestinigallinarum]|nr:polysaccharide deacetylase family protein [Candidatus Pullilachnospira intestinigallinarum]
MAAAGMVLAVLALGANGGIRKDSFSAFVSAGQEKPMIALTFDDGPSQYSEALLDGLKERKVQATFFLLGVNMEGNEEIVRRMEEEGHLLGNHTYHHVQLNKIGLREASEEILTTNNRIYEASGEYPIYIRPPYGEWSEALEEKVEMIPVFWTVDSLDWKLKEADSIRRHVLENVEEGDIILMHDGYESSVEAALDIVDRLLAEGYQFVTADRLVMD